ncbi:MAG: hypothetical protein Q7V00_10830 [Sulfurimicrobium sp.]|nr:hypothetical protein [Sulfurimicrobium sp.]MDO9189866.1 hypothetical protein [Sulfurimicrobium sp.]MDP2198919.1 hypothetical protein [Sulfurimicrobium sp.]
MTTSNCLTTLYDAAASAGLLTPAVFGGMSVMVDFRAPDEDVLDGLGISRNYSIRYPVSWLPQLAAGDSLEIASQSYRVREITALGDGTEQRATLTRL